MANDGLTVGVALNLGDAPAMRYVDEARHAANVGFDFVAVPDHLGMAAPLPTLAAIAMAVPGVQVTNFLLNAAFYRPHLLARDIATVHQLSGGRFITSLGTGYVEAEFDAVGIEFPSAGERVRALRDTIVALGEILADPVLVPPTDLPPPRVLVAGRGDRLLAVAAEHADIVLINADVTEPELAERIDYVRTRAGARADDLVFGISISQFVLDGFGGVADDLAHMRAMRPNATDDDIRAMVATLCGTIDDALARIERVHRMGVGYLVFNRLPGVGWDVLEWLLGGLRAAR